MSHEVIRSAGRQGPVGFNESLTASSRPATSGSTFPLVSVCIPAFNAARWILDCLDSAVNQSYQPLEVLVIDDGSTDGTVELIRSIDDQRIRLLVNEQNIGLTRNWNKCIELARGDFIKFLFHDDILYPDCIEKMMRVVLSNENVGLVFSPRDIIVEGDPQTELTKIWLQNCSTLHTKFLAIEPVNPGRELFIQYLNRGFRGNWIGEPSSVLIRKECFSRVGSFNPNLYQVCDVEMWLRIMFFYDVGFLPEKLSAFRFHSDSTSHRNIVSRRNFLDQLWLLESLSNCEAIKSEHPEIERIRALELLRLVKASLLRPSTIVRWLRTDPVARQGVLLLPKWIRSAAAYSASKLLRLRVPANG
jgi:glycosyltransferase involved in cell wall biosynthesis